MWEDKGLHLKKKNPCHINHVNETNYDSNSYKCIKFTHMQALFTNKLTSKSNLLFWN